MMRELEETLDQTRKSKRAARVDVDARDSEWRSNHTAEPVRADKRKVQFAWLKWERPGAIPSPLNEI